MFLSKHKENSIIGKDGWVKDPVINKQSLSHSIFKEHLTQLIIPVFVENGFHLASCHHTSQFSSPITGHFLSSNCWFLFLLQTSNAEKT